jgi:tetratricopeptide (TPR) repeat protein
MSRTLLSLGDAALDQGDITTATQCFQQAANLFQALNDPYTRNWAMIMLARSAYMRRDGDQAQAILEECLTFARAIGDLHAVATAQIEVARVARLDNDIARAAACFSESLALSRDIGGSEFLVTGLEGLAGIAAMSDQPKRAARLFGAAEALRESADIPLPPVLRADYDRDVTAVSAQLDEPAFASAWAVGRALPLEQAIGEALAVIPDKMAR